MRCYLHVLNITVRRCCQAGFGSKGDMDNAHICQLHYKITWVHHERPNFCKSIYVEPHLLKCGSRHAGSTSINVLNGTLSMVPLVWLLHVKWLLPASDSHLNVWKVIVKFLQDKKKYRKRRAKISLYFKRRHLIIYKYSENLQVNSSFIN